MFNLISDIVNHNFFAVVHQVAYGCNLKWSLMSLIFQVILRLISKPASADIETTFGLKNYYFRVSSQPNEDIYVTIELGVFKSFGHKGLCGGENREL